MLRILIVEDEIHNREALSEVVRRLGHTPIVAEDGQQGLEIALQQNIDVIFSDIRMPRMDGHQFFSTYQNMVSLTSDRVPFVFMTGYGQLEEAVNAMKQGALHFLNKPLRKKEIAAVLDEVKKIVENRKAGRVPSGKTRKDNGEHEAVFGSRAFSDVVQLIDRVAPSLASVLLVGESGTGKEVLAKRVHQKSGRGGGPFVAFHSGATPESLMESELFGHEKGAFTGAHEARLGQIRAAQRGTFFLDELSSMPLSVQAKLLRVLQDRSVTPLGSTHATECDVRWVAATNVPLEPLVESGRFREDLLFRLKVVVVEIPPLRNRPEDIKTIALHFIEEMAQREARAPLRLGSKTLGLLEAYSWPGNVRELRNVIERAAALAPLDNDELVPQLLPEHIRAEQRAREIRVMVGTSLESVEDRLIEETLISCGGDKTRAAAILGVAPRTIYRWIERKGPSARAD